MYLFASQEGLCCVELVIKELDAAHWEDSPMWCGKKVMRLIFF